MLILSMKNRLTTIIIALILSTLLIQCDRYDLYEVKSPQSITVIAGDKQFGYPGERLTDSVVIVVEPDNITDLHLYAYSFEHAGSNLWHHYSEIRDEKLYVTAFWSLEEDLPSQELTFYLSYKSHPDNITGVKVIDSITVNATLKQAWKKTYTISNGTFNDIFFSDANNGILVGDLTSGIGYLTTKDGGDTWHTAASGYKSIFHLSFANSDTGIALASNNKAYFTNNGGQSFYMAEWTPPFSDGVRAEDLHRFNANEMIVVGQQGAIARTVDAGNTWENYSGFTFANSLYDITSVDDSTCYACGQIAKIIKTTDRGVTWKEQHVQLNNYLKKIYFVTNKFGFAGGLNGALIRTTNGGDNWTIVNTGLRSTIIQIHFVDDNTGYIFSISGEIAKTLNGGKSWTTVNKAYKGISNFNKVLVKDHIVWGLEDKAVYTYNLENE